MIKPKEKPCKGTGLAKGYGCGKLTYHRTYGLGKMCCYSDWLLTSENGKIKLEKAMLKATKPRRELEKAEQQEKQNKSLSILIKSVVNIFHKYVRERDKGKPCIACGTKWHKDFHASHYFKAELYTTLKLHENNVHGGCVRCNLREEGNLSEYAVNLPKRIGEKAFKELNELAEKNHQTVFKWDREELNKIRNYYKQKLKEL